MCVLPAPNSTMSDSSGGYSPWGRHNVHLPTAQQRDTISQDLSRDPTHIQQKYDVKMHPHFQKAWTLALVFLFPLLFSLPPRQIQFLRMPQQISVHLFSPTESHKCEEEIHNLGRLQTIMVLPRCLMRLKAIYLFIFDIKGFCCYWANKEIRSKTST